MFLTFLTVFYFGVAIFCLSRYAFIAKKFFKPMKEDGIHIPIFQWLVPAVKDSLKWPWYVLWFGLKQWLEDLR